MKTLLFAFKYSSLSTDSTFDEHKNLNQKFSYTKAYDKSLNNELFVSNMTDDNDNTSNGNHEMKRSDECFSVIDNNDNEECTCSTDKVTQSTNGSRLQSNVVNKITKVPNVTITVMTNLGFCLDIHLASTESHDTWVPGLAYCAWRNWITRINLSLKLPAQVILQTDGGMQNLYLAAKVQEYLHNIYFKDLFKDFDAKQSQYKIDTQILKTKQQKIANECKNCIYENDQERLQTLLTDQKSVKQKLLSLQSPIYPLPLLKVCNNVYHKS